MSSRSAGYSAYEDVSLCEIYIEISQDPITGVQQSADNFWSRVEDAYNKSRAETEHRTRRSLQSRWQIIEKAVRKLLGCIRQIENMNPSGASDQDILDRAKILLMQDANYKKGFKFDHVWNIVKNFEKFRDDVQTARQVYRHPPSTYISSESDNPTPESHVPESPGLSDFSVNLNDDDASGSSSKRPIGVKKAKSKRKIEGKAAYEINALKEENKQIFNMLKKSTEDRQVAFEIERNKLEIQKRKLYLKELREENKIMFIDLDQIRDPNRRAFIAAQQKLIMQKRSQSQSAFHADQQSQPQPQPQPPPPPPSQSNIFGDYFPNISGGGTDLPDY